MAKKKEKSDNKSKEKEKPRKKTAKDKKPAAPPQETKQAGQIGALPLNIHAQYVRDISFENPKAPGAIRAGHATPKTRVNFGMNARKLEGDLKDMYEVILTVNAEGHRDGNTVFIAEIQYGVTVSVNESVPKEQIHPLLLIEIPRLAFPFVRQILSDLSINGGYPPLILQPVNFHKLYVDQFKDQLAGTDNATVSLLPSFNHSALPSFSSIFLCAAISSLPGLKSRG